MDVEGVGLKASKIIGIILIILSGFLLVGGIATILITLILPFEIVKPWVDSFAHDGEVTLFTEAYFSKLIIYPRLFGIALLFVGTAIFIGRHWIQRQLLKFLSALPSASDLYELTLGKLRKEEKSHLYAFSIIILSAIAVRGVYLFQPMRYDECVTFSDYASRPLFIGLTNYSLPNNHLFHTFLVHITTSVLGNQPWVIRLPALIAGILVVPAAYLLIRSLYDKHSALVGSALVASSSTLVEFSTNGRGYTLIVLFFLSILLLGNHIRKTGEWVWWILAGILSVLGFYTIPIMLYPFGIFVTWLLLSAMLDKESPDRSVFIKGLIITCVFTALLTLMLYAPVFAVSGVKAVSHNQFVRSKPWSIFIHRIPELISSVWHNWNKNIPFPLTYLLLIGFLISLVFNRRLRKDKHFSIILSSVISCALLLLLQRVIPFVRVWMFLVPLYLGTAACGIGFLIRLLGKRVNSYERYIFAILAVGLSIFLGVNVVLNRSVYYSTGIDSLRDAEKIDMYLNDLLEPDDIVLTNFIAASILQYYHSKRNNSPRNVYVHELGSEPVINSDSRIFLLFSKSYDRTMEKIMETELITKLRLSILRLVREYESASLYELTGNGGNRESPS